MTLVAKKIIDDRTIELTFPANPDGKYLLKGGTRAVWDKFQLPPKWRSRLGEGLIEGKRCGVTQNIGPAARHDPNYGVRQRVSVGEVSLERPKPTLPKRRASLRMETVILQERLFLRAGLLSLSQFANNIVMAAKSW